MNIQIGRGFESWDDANDDDDEETIYSTRAPGKRE